MAAIPYTNFKFALVVSDGKAKTFIAWTYTLVLSWRICFAAPRIDSRVLLPVRGRCLMKMLPAPLQDGRSQDREAIEFENQIRTTTGDCRALSLGNRC